MKKMTILLILMIMIFSISCKKTENTPPPFGAPPVEKMMRGAFTGTVPTGFGVPVDVFNSDVQIIQEIPKLSADPSDTNIPTVSVKVDQTGGWIWNEGARYDWSTRTWVKFTFPQTTYGTTKWIRGSTSVDLTTVPYNSVNIKENIPTAQQDPEGENLVVAFSCKRYSGEWRCGCSSTTEAPPCAKWMARKHTVLTELPSITDPGMPPNLFEAPTPTSTQAPPEPTATPIPTPTPVPYISDILFTQGNLHVNGGPDCPTEYQKKGIVVDCDQPPGCNGHQSLCVKYSTTEQPVNDVLITQGGGHLDPPALTCPSTHPITRGAVVDSENNERRGHVLLCLKKDTPTEPKILNAYMTPGGDPRTDADTCQPQGHTNAGAVVNCENNHCQGHQLLCIKG